LAASTASTERSARHARRSIERRDIVRFVLS